MGLRHTETKKAVESPQSLRENSAGSPVLVYRSTSKTWEGPVKIIQMDGETVLDQMGRGRKIFRSSSVKPIVRSKLEMPDDMNIPCNGKFSIVPKMTDKDFAN